MVNNVNPTELRQERTRIRLHTLQCSQIARTVCRIHVRLGGPISVGRQNAPRGILPTRTRRALVVLEDEFFFFWYFCAPYAGSLPQGCAKQHGRVVLHGGQRAERGLHPALLSWQEHAEAVGRLNVHLFSARRCCGVRTVRVAGIDFVFLGCEVTLASVR